MPSASDLLRVGVGKYPSALATVSRRVSIKCSKHTS